MSSNLTSHEPFVLKHTNVSNPSVIHSKPSQQSITASEDYYSLSGSSAASINSVTAAHRNAQSQHTITRSQTPPSRYRTPQQSTTYLPQQSKDCLSLRSREQLPSQQPYAQPQTRHYNGQAQPSPSSHLPEGSGQEQHAAFEQESEEIQQGRKTPMRGEGRRRSSVIENPTVALLGGSGEAVTRMSTQQRRGEGGQRAQRENSFQPAGGVAASQARSSVARDLDRDANSTTPGVDDTLYIRFALEQLTRDEEVRGSRVYAPLLPGLPSQPPVLTPPQAQPQLAQAQAQQPLPLPLPLPQPQSQSQPWRHGQTDQWPRDPRVQDEDDVDEDEIEESVPLRGPQRPLAPELPPPPTNFKEGHNVFIPLSQQNARQPPLNFLPGILRLPAIAAYLTLLLAYLACLAFAASWSRAHTGLWRYSSFGDGRYFVFQFLPTLLGMALLLWLIQIELAVYRIAPFIAIASPSPQRRAIGARLPLVPHGFVLPYVGHFRASQPVVGVFLLVAWLQVFTLPLLGSSFNVYYAGSPSNGQWRWIATQGVIWVVVALYVLLIVSTVALFMYLRRSTTGLRRDPRSLADIIVLLERSNALDLHDPIGQLGYWRTTNSPNEVLHTLAIADKPARSYAMEDGQIREKAADPAPPRRYSDPDADLEAGQPRASKDAILPSTDIESSDSEHRNGPLPWFLWPSFALLWPIIAIVLLVAFLIVSYLPSTRISAGFVPSVPIPVNTMGFSSANLLYSFVPSLLGTLCFLFWLDIDYAYRRLQPLASLGASTGALAEHTLLTTYPSDKPVFVTLSALANAHYRVAFLTLITLVSLALPVLASGVFWAQFDIATQRTLITANMTAFYALTALVALYALAYLAVFPPAALRALPRNVAYSSIADLRALLSQSRLLTDVAFRAPASRTDLVTRLLSPFPGIYLTSSASAAARGQHYAGASASAPNASKLSLADSVRGFGRARPPPLAREMGEWNALPRYAFGRHAGRDGREFVGLDRLRV